MKLTAAIKHRQTATYQKFIVRQDPVTFEQYREYIPGGTLELTIVAPTSGSSYAYCDQEILAYQRITNIKDRNGVTMFADAAQGYEFSVVKPVLDPMGNITGYSASLVKVGTTNQTA